MYCNNLIKFCKPNREFHLKPNDDLTVGDQLHAPFFVCRVAELNRGNDGQKIQNFREFMATYFLAVCMRLNVTKQK